MRKLTAAVLLLTLSLFTGCYKQDYSICSVEENCVLLFELEAESGSAEFKSNITSIDVALFGSDGTLYTHQRVEKAQLEVFQGIKLTVDPGIYHVVAWGNVSECSRLSTNNGGGATPFTGSYLQTVSDQTGCNLYYAPSKEIELLDPSANVTPDSKLYEVDVKPNRVTRKELNFTRANRRVRVYLKDFDGITQIKLGNIPDRYDYYLRAFPSRKDYTQPTRKAHYDQTADMVDMSEFRAPIVPFESAMRVDIISTGTRAEEIIRSVNLKEWVEENRDQITDMNEISILFTKQINGAVEITVPNWNDDDVKPVW